MENFLEVHPKKKSFLRYRTFDAGVFKECKILAKKARGLQILHINSAPEGGGVAELLKSQVPLERDLGIASKWYSLKADKDFFRVTKKIHNLLQGDAGQLEEDEKTFYLESLKQAGRELNNFLSSHRKRIVVLHDPQVLPLIEYLPKGAYCVVRLHMHLEVKNNSTLFSLTKFLEKADQVVVSNRAFVPEGSIQKKTLVSFPAIDPFEPKNTVLNKSKGSAYLKRFGIDETRSLIVQVSRFDKWKDPEGVIKAYYLAKRQIPGLQLVMEGAIIAQDDPEAYELYNRLKAKYQNDKDLFLLGENNLSSEDMSEWVNCLQSKALVVIQKSLREGFGLTVSEALWKGKVVIGGDALGIKAQITNGFNGYIVQTSKQCADRIVQLIKNPTLANKMGIRGRNEVRKRFLFNSLIHDFLDIYNSFLQKD